MEWNKWEVQFIFPGDCVLFLADELFLTGILTVTLAKILRLPLWGTQNDEKHFQTLPLNRLSSLGGIQ